MEERGYTVIRCLGQGGQSRVYEVRDRAGKLRVLKQLTWLGEHDKEAALQEVRLLSSLRHPCIVPYLESFLARSTPSVPSEDLLCLVMSRCERDLREECLRRREKGVGFEEPRILSWLAQLCWGLQHLHARKFLHRDLKSQNVLLTQSGRVLLADFGVAGHLDHTEDFRRSIVGTPAFMSPEMLEGRPYGCETDQWALGCVLYEIMALEPPFAAAESYAAVVAAVLHSPDHIRAPLGYGPWGGCYSPELNAIVEALLARKPHERPSNTELLRGTVLRAQFNTFLQSLEATASGTDGASSKRANLAPPGIAAAVPSPVPEGTPLVSTPSEHSAGNCSSTLADTWRRDLVAGTAWTPDLDESPTTGFMIHEAEAAAGVVSMPSLSDLEFWPGVYRADDPTSAADGTHLGRMAGLSPTLAVHPWSSLGAMPSFRSDMTTSTEDLQEMSTNVLGDAGVGAGEWRQLLAEAESLLQPTMPDRLALEEVTHLRQVRAALCDLLGTEEQVNRALGFLRERRPLGLGEAVEAEADELLLQVEVLDLLGDEGLRALPLLERLLALESRTADPFMKNHGDFLQ